MLGSGIARSELFFFYGRVCTLIDGIPGDDIVTRRSGALVTILNIIIYVYNEIQHGKATS